MSTTSSPKLSASSSEVITLSSDLLSPEYPIDLNSIEDDWEILDISDTILQQDISSHVSPTYSQSADAAAGSELVGFATVISDSVIAVANSQRVADNVEVVTTTGVVVASALTELVSHTTIGAISVLNSVGRGLTTILGSTTTPKQPNT